MYYQKWERQIFSEKLLQFLSIPLTKQLANMVFKYLKYSTYTKGKKKLGISKTILFFMFLNKTAFILSKIK